MDVREECRKAAAAGNAITTKEGARITGYTADHIGLLLRRGAVKGQKIGRDWLIDAMSLYRYVKKNPKPGRKPI